MSSDGGGVLLRRIDDDLGLTSSLAAALGDRRDVRRIKHSVVEMLRQRVYQIALGYEDCNDADVLRADELLQVVCANDEAHLLSSQPTLSRFENGVGGKALREAWRVLERQFVEGLAPSTPLIVLDIDSTDDPTHGEQQLAFFHGFYDQHMYHPLLVFDERGQLVTALLRPGRAHAAWGAEGTLRRLISAIRARCPEAQIVIRGDSAYAMPWLLEALDEIHQTDHDVHYVFGIAQNPTLLALATPFMQAAAAEYRASERHVRRFAWLKYAAATWSHGRDIVLKAEHGDRGQNPRFLVTNVTWCDPRSLYDGAFCPRGQAENYIKDFKNALRADRLSCHRFVANAVRLLLHAAAYRLMYALRERVAGFDQTLGRAQMDTLRIRLLKVAAIVRVSVRRVVIQLSSSFTHAGLLSRLLASPG